MAPVPHAETLTLLLPQPSGPYDTWQLQASKPGAAQQAVAVHALAAIVVSPLPLSASAHVQSGPEPS